MLYRAMCSLLTYSITSRIIDWVDTGMDQAKAATIITDEGGEIPETDRTRIPETD